MYTYTYPYAYMTYVYLHTYTSENICIFVLHICIRTMAELESFRLCKPLQRPCSRFAASLPCAGDAEASIPASLPGRLQQKEHGKRKDNACVVPPFICFGHVPTVWLVLGLYCIHSSV